MPSIDTKIEIAADYNFGQTSAEWVRQIVKENGGTLVGEEFIPLDVSIRKSCIVFSDHFWPLGFHSVEGCFVVLFGLGVVFLATWGCSHWETRLKAGLGLVCIGF